ncbi:MAG: SoxR reducing system RseC family protein [Bacteroidales bacterium]
MNSQISHQGTVLHSTSDKVIVQVLSVSACGSCHVKSACTMADMKEKQITIDIHNQLFKEGDTVEIHMKQHQGLFAVLLAYVVPLFMLVVTLAVGIHYFNELISGLFSIGIVIIYYMVLRFFKDNLNKKFTYELIKV